MNWKRMSFLIKIFFALCVFFLVGITTLIAIKEVEIPQETITETVPNDRLFDE